MDFEGIVDVGVFLFFMFVFVLEGKFIMMTGIMQFLMQMSFFLKILFKGL